jgi:tetratricopeptide (TPR) repeat protein
MARQWDPRGLAVTATNKEAAACFDDAVDAFVGHRADCAARIADALRADPEFLLAHCLQGFTLKLMARQEFAAPAAASLAHARESARAWGATPRETAITEALASWCDGDMRRAGEILSAQLTRDPHDLLSIKLHHAVQFMLGDRQAMLETLRSAVAAWDETMPGLGFVLGCYAFALEENGAYESAERLGRRASSINPTDIWAVHAVAHVFEMRGEPHTGLRWLNRQRDSFAGCGNLTFHLAWHRALFHLALDQPGRALALYDDEVRGSETDDYRDIANAVSLLWRLENCGLAVGGRWYELADKAAVRLGDSSLVFASIHHMLSLAGAGRYRAAETLLRSLRLQAQLLQGTQSAVLAAIGIPLAEAVLAASRRQHRRVVDLLFPLRHRIASIGGSNAQRDVLMQLLIDAAVAADRQDEALILLQERGVNRSRSGWASARVSRLISESDRSSNDRQAL